MTIKWENRITGIEEAGADTFARETREISGNLSWDLNGKQQVFWVETKAEALSLMCSSGRKVTGTREQRESRGKREMLLQGSWLSLSHTGPQEAMWRACFKAVLGNLSFKHGSDNLSDVLEKRNSACCVTDKGSSCRSRETRKKTVQEELYYILWK